MSIRWVLGVGMLAMVGLSAPMVLAQDAKKEPVQKKVAKKKAKKKKQVSPADALFKANRLASRGALSRAIPFYKTTIEHGQESFPVAHFNMGEVYKSKKKYADATLHYHAYLALGSDGDARKLSKRGLRECRRAEWSTLAVSVSPLENARVLVNGNMLAKGKNLEAVTLAPGTYEIEVRAQDHMPQKETVTLGKEPIERSFTLTRQTFFGKARIDISIDGATVKLEPKKLDKENAEAKTLVLTAPMKAPLELATGKYFLEITKDGYERWIRNIYVTRDGETQVSAKLQKSLPPEIR